MEIVVPILIVLLLLSLDLKKVNKKYEKLISITLVFVLSFTYDMGIDWTHYKDFYINIVSKVKFENITFETALYEKGYVVLNYIFYGLGFNYDIFMGILRGSCLYFIFRILYKNSENYLFSLVIITTSFLFSYSTEPVIRQFIAITFSCYALESLIKKKYILYVFYTLIAYQFHSSAIICFFYIFLCYMRFNLKKMIVISLILELVILNLEKILNFLISFNPNFFKYKMYINSIGKNPPSILGIITLFIIFILYVKPIASIKNIKTRRNKIYINFLYIYLIFVVLGRQLIFLSRFEGYFLMSVSIILSKYTEMKILNFKLGRNKLILLIGILNISLFTFGLLRTEGNRYKYLKYNNYIIKVLKNSFELESKENEMKNLEKYKVRYFRILKKYKN